MAPNAPAPASAGPASVAAPVAPTAPTTTPTTPSPAASPAESFDNLGSADDLDAVVELPADSTAAPTTETEGATPPTDASGEPPKEPPAATASPQPEPPKEPPKEPKKDGAAAPAPSPAPAAAERDDSPQGLVNQLVQHREAVLDALAGDRFKLSEAETKALDTDAVGAIPRVMARVYYEAMQSTLLHIQNLVPQTVQRVLQAQKANDEVENAFYAKFSALDRSKHAQDVAQFAQLMRQSNPQISRDDLFAMVGAAVMAKYGLTAQPAPVANGNGAAPPRPAQPAPFVPAKPGVSVKTTPEPESPWAGMAMDFDE